MSTSVGETNGAGCLRQRRATKTYHAPVSAILAVAASVFYGAGDFLGGLATRRSPVLSVLLVAQVSGYLVLLPALLLVPAVAPSTRDVVWGAVAGVAGGLGIAGLYVTLARGPMSLVAPVTAVCALALPVLVGLAMGERPGSRPLLGIVMAVLAVVLVSRPPEDAPGSAADRRTTLLLALVTGAFVGSFVALMGNTDPRGGLWPLLAARVVVTVGIVGCAVARREAILGARPALAAALASGALDMAGNVTYVLASQQQLLSLSATLVSLYPATTVALAWVVTGERLGGVQRVGLVAALVAIVLITAP